MMIALLQLDNKFTDEEGLWTLCILWKDYGSRVVSEN